MEGSEGRAGAASSSAEQRRQLVRDEDSEGQIENGNSRQSGIDEGKEMSLQEVLYGVSSYYAIAKPVSATMILSALCVIYVNTEETLAQGQQQLGMYTAFEASGGDGSSSGNAKALGLSVANALIIVSVICAMTFGIVLLYRYRCMKCLVGYMVLSSATLLGLLGGTMFAVAIDKYRLPVDLVSFYFAVFNFAAVGTLSIFFHKGIPTVVTQSYLVATSVILAWQLSRFDPWTAWTLLVMLALYDLCAVLTPCGPLKALVNLMQRDGSPPMPGLLYEAELPLQAQRPTRRPSPALPRTPDTSQTLPAYNTHQTSIATNAPPLSPTHRIQTTHPDAENSLQRIDDVNTGYHASTSVEQPIAVREQPANSTFPADVPLAIAQVYNLPITAPDHIVAKIAANQQHSESQVQHSSPSPVSAALTSQLFTPTELKSDVRVLFPLNGGRITAKTDHSDGSYRYVVTDRLGEVKRILLVDHRGKVLEEITRVQGDRSAGKDATNSSIKLGLGDFIFYSVLVSKAAMYSFSTYAACMLVILAGLGGTLVLLSVYHHALPALPISIFLGVAFYLLTRILIEPWIHDVLKTPFYV